MDTGGCLPVSRLLRLTARKSESFTPMRRQFARLVACACQRSRRRADESAAFEHVERSRPLADEVRRRLEAGAPADAAAREKRDLVVAEVPRGRFGDVPRVGVPIAVGHVAEHQQDLAVGEITEPQWKIMA